ncbi:MAG TPA: hypothetical protein VHK90_07455, partial [Thermoanaerobaculia bacterium]|nr:hypothetical protein [Thermoanaerobaculia bacterium]
ESNEMFATFSPDGKWIAYISATSETDAEVYIRPFPKGRALRVSTDGGGPPSWSRDGRELVWGSKSRVLAASVNLSGSTPEIGAPRELFRLPRIWSKPLVMKDGRIALMVPSPDADLSSAYHITTAWRTKLK